MSLEVLPMLKKAKEEDRYDSILHHHRLWHLLRMSDLHKNTKMISLYHLLDSDQVHESLVIPAGVDSLRWKDWFLRVDENLHRVGSGKIVFGHLKHLLVLEKVVKIPLSDCPGIAVFDKKKKRDALFKPPQCKKVAKHILALHGKKLIESHPTLIPEKAGL